MVACQCHDGIDGPTSAHTADLGEPAGIERVAGLPGIQQNRVATDHIPGICETWSQSIDDRLVPSHEYPAITVLPAPPVPIAQGLAKTLGAVRAEIHRRFGTRRPAPRSRVAIVLARRSTGCMPRDHPPGAG
ncbi:hypothetical protein WT77_20885 [Burkholderia stagnalis]|nr:hypothetical protein WT18_02815 [Burkholderia stagnalis]KVP10955.1 hypothetical protein WT20_15405 [Burkholderia stagnalis]KVW98667.1 hypothetical protein WT30_07285 [Burkholderia stagnalis]KWH83056.1 hypothetical protein WT66_08665 [Burkholderia stagnalis]KWK21883.1 hypothetical protein WT77_20885 [Burkholderia stagnalis]